MGMAKHMGSMLRVHTNRTSMSVPEIASVESAGHGREEFGLFTRNPLVEGQRLLMFFTRHVYQKFVPGDDPSEEVW